MIGIDSGSKIEFILKKLYYMPQSALDYTIDDELEAKKERSFILTKFEFEYDSMTYFNDLFCSNEFAKFICDNSWNGEFIDKLTMNSLRLMARFMYDGKEVHDYYITDFENKTEDDIEKEAQELSKKVKQDLINDSTFKGDPEEKAKITYKSKKISYWLWKERYSNFSPEQIERIKKFDIEMAQYALAEVNQRIMMKAEIEEEPIRDREFLYERLEDEKTAIEEIAEIHTMFLSDNPNMDIPKTNIRFLLVSNKFLNIIERLIAKKRFYSDIETSYIALDVINQVIGKSIEIKECNKDYSEKFIPDFKRLKKEFDLEKAKIILIKCIEMYEGFRKKSSLFLVK